MTPKEKRRMWLRLLECVHVSEDTSHFKFRFLLFSLVILFYSAFIRVCVCMFFLCLCVCAVV